MLDRFTVPRRGFAAATLILGGCAAVSPIQGEQVQLPSFAHPPEVDAVRPTIFRLAFAFSDRRMFAGNPAVAARALGDAEFLAAALPTEGRYHMRNQLVAAQFIPARLEWRRAMGVAPEWPAQLLINAFYAAWFGLSNNDRPRAVEAMRPVLFAPAGEAALARLADLPPLPLTTSAASAVGQEVLEAGFTYDGRR